MTTKTASTLSPIKRCHGSPHLKKRRLSSLLIHHRQQQQQMNVSLSIPTITSSPTIITVSYEKQLIPSLKLPDLVNDIVVEQQKRRETIVNIASILRKVGDQMDEQLQINNTSSSIDHIFSQRTMTYVHYLSGILRFFW